MSKHIGSTSFDDTDCSARLRSRLDDYQALKRASYVVRGQSKKLFICDSLSVVSHNEQRDLRMARLPRFSLPSIPQHIIQLDNNRQAYFYAEEDYRFYWECLGEAARKYQVSVHAYVLMTHHVHRLMTPTSAAGTTRVMQTLGRRYVRYVNHTYRRSGTLWEGRYPASLVQGD